MRRSSYATRSIAIAAERAAAAAGDLATISGVECHVLVPGHRDDRHIRSCCICDALLRGHLSPTVADQTHRLAAYQSERLGGRYLYACPYTLLHAAAPVITDDAVAAVIVCGPAVLGTVDDQVLAAIRRSESGSMMSVDAASAWVRSLPVLSPSEATALSDTLARIAGTCCDRAGAELLANATEPPRDDELGEYVHYLTSMEGDKRSSMRYPVERERELLDLVTAGDRAGAERSLQHLLHAVSSYEVKSADEARSRVLELVVLLSRAAIAGGADAEHVFGLEYRSLSRLRSLTSIEEIAAWLARVLSRFLDLVFDLREVRYSTHLSRVLQYVRDNFRRGITLADAAADAGLSSGYLGRIFREELQTSFTRYVQRVRIQEARRLLARTRLPVGDVGAQCGFPDHSYFTQLFRRETGESPTEYRDRSPTRWRRPL